MTTLGEKALSRVRDERIKDILSVVQERKKYPQDVLTNGAFDILVGYIVELEGKCVNMIR